MEKKLSRRGFLRAFGIGAAVSALAACKPKVVEVTKVVEKVVKETVVVEKEKEKVVTKVVEKVVKQTVEVQKPAEELTGELIFWGHDQHPIDLVATGFVQRHPKVKWISPHPADRGQKFTAAMAAGSGCPDLFWAEATDAQTWGCNELLTDLTEELLPYKDDFHPLKLNETYIVKTGKYIGWPGDISVSGYYYRPDKFAELGYGDVDWENLTYDDFCLMSAEIAKKGHYTFCFPGDGWAALFMYALHQLGGTAVSKDGQKITVADEKGIQAMTIVKKLWDSGGGLDVSWWSAPYWGALQDGTLIGDFAAAWARGFWEAQIKTSEAGIGLWRIAPFPTGPGIKYRSGVWGGAQLVNPKCSKNKENAIAFMKYGFGTIEGAGLAGSWGIVPGYRPYLRSPLFLRMKSPVFGDWYFNEFWAKQEKELSTEFYRPAGWGAVNGIIQKEMVPILKGELSVEEGMKRIVELATPDFERTMCKL
ncbi:MAG: extracellular solute-binding protein [Anaerolineae bacterium]|nr:extracellular solute-binding protein [Anaerolineae bacterium]